MDLLQIIALALIQGITEFLPISSSAHLILPSAILGWQDQGLGFDIAVHLATLLAVVFHLRKLLLKTTYGFFASRASPSSADTMLVYKLIVATIPAIVVGFFIKDWIATWGRNDLVIATTTIVFGVLLAIAGFGKKNKTDIYNLSWKIVIFIGLMQALALIPGTSRSGITITAALLVGINSTNAAKFSFLLSIPVILGASLLMLLDAYNAKTIYISWQYFSIGFGTAFIVAIITLTLFMRFIDKLGMMPFAIYRVLLGLLLFSFYF